MNVTLSSDVDKLNTKIKKELRRYTDMAMDPTTGGFLVKELYFTKFQDIDQANTYIKDGIQKLTTEHTIMAQIQRATMSITGSCKKAVVWCSHVFQPKDGDIKTKKQ